MSEKLAILWHLHQPDYRHPRDGRPVMPWVRLHSLRGYRDMVVETLEGDIDWTLNVVPSLLDQWLWYAAGGVDRHQELTAIPAEDLSEGDIGAIRQGFVAGNHRMIDQHPRYRGLAAQVRAGAPLSRRDLRDLQVWSTLAWFGATALRDFPVLRALRAKGEGFDEADKGEMLAAQAVIVVDLPGRYGTLAQKGKLATTPAWHPILPLLVDTAHAQRSLPGVPDVGFAFPADALEQLRRARARWKAFCGVEPHGLWPSEGAVSPEALCLALAAGFQWFVSDEVVLARSDRGPGPTGGPWEVEGMKGFFRDHDLSDRVGFNYATWPAEQAVADLIGGARRREGELCVISLDGENPWEAFLDAGAAFRAHLAKALKAGPVRGVTFEEAAKGRSVGVVHQIHTGSWIGGDLRIWYGDPEDREGWRVLTDLRRAIAAAPEAEAAAALEHALAAEGSDWFWWLGPEFDTPFLGEFDEMFRLHLIAGWKALGRQPPDELSRPISRRAGRPVVVSQAGGLALRPGQTSWVRWRGAGRAHWPRGSSMGASTGHLEPLWFAADHLGLWLRAALSSDPPGEPTWEISEVPVSMEIPAEGGVAGWRSGRIVGAFVPWDRLPEGDVAVVLRSGPARWPVVGELVVPDRVLTGRPRRAPADSRPRVTGLAEGP